MIFFSIKKYTFTFFIILLTIEYSSAMQDKEIEYSSSEPIYKDIPSIGILNENEYEFDKDFNQKQKINQKIKNETEEKLQRDILLEKKLLKNKQKTIALQLEKEEKELEELEEKEQEQAQLIAKKEKRLAQQEELLAQQTEAQKIARILIKFTKKIDLINPGENIDLENMALITNSAVNIILKYKPISPDESCNNIKLVAIAINDLNRKLKDKDFTNANGVDKALQLLDKALSFYFQPLFDNYPDYKNKPNRETDTPEVEQVRDLYIQKKQLEDLVKKINLKK